MDVNEKQDTPHNLFNTSLLPLVMTSADESKTSPDGPVQYKNAARASALSGRYHPKKYTSPLDTKNLITPGEFHRQFIKNGSKNPYTQRRSASEVPAPVNKLRQSLDSPVTPVTALSGTTQRSLTNSSVGGDTYHENDDNAPLGWYYSGFTQRRSSGLC